MLVPRAIINGKVLVGCHSRLGNVTRTGPITSKEHHITMLGTWVDEEDAELMVNLEEKVPCNRKRDGFRTIVGLFYLDPTTKQIEEASR